MPVKVDRQAVRSTLGVSEATVLVGFIGRLSRQKAPEVLVAAAALLPPDLPEHRICVIGSGPLEDTLRRSALEYGVGDRFIWLGGVDGSHYVLAFDILVLSSDYEGFPYVFLEALQSALPIVSTPVGGAQGVVTHLDNGLIFPRRDENTLAQSLAYLIREPSVRARMGARSLKRAANFTIDRMIKAIQAEYEGCSSQQGLARTRPGVAAGPTRGGEKPPEAAVGFGTGHG